jgi:NADH-quinone oxidoreductase subunit G
LRQSAKRGTQVSLIHSADDDQLIKLAGKLIAAPSRLPEQLAQVVKAVAELKGAASDLAVTVTAEAKRVAESLVSGQNAAVLLGNFAQQHPRAATLTALAQQLAGLLGGRYGCLGEAANSVGGYLAKTIPADGGLDARAMIAAPRKAYLLVGAEPELDCADGRQALAAMKQAETVIVMSPFKSQAALDYADALLPVAPFSETSGTFVSMEGRVQSFHAVARPAGETRPAWKVLRVLGNLLKLEGFEQESSESVREEVLGGDAEFAAGLDNAVVGIVPDLTVAQGMERIADVPIHFADPLVRRSACLQRTRDAAAPVARMNAATLARAGVRDGDFVRVKSDGGDASLAAALDVGLPDNCVRVAAAHATTANLGALFGAIAVERV